MQNSIIDGSLSAKTVAFLVLARVPMPTRCTVHVLYSYWMFVYHVWTVVLPEESKRVHYHLRARLTQKYLHPFWIFVLSPNASLAR